MKSFAICLLLGQDVLAERVMLDKQRNSAGSSKKRGALNNRLKQFRDDNNHLNLQSKSLEALASKSFKGILQESPFQESLRKLTKQGLGERKSSGVFDYNSRKSSSGD
jgi:hypothetical protein